MLEILSADYLDEYKIAIHFNNGESKVTDLSEHLWGPVFEPLRDKELFKKFRVEWGTLTWDNEADFAPEFLYGIGRTELVRSA